jgi:hypothetical protein
MRADETDAIIDLILAIQEQYYDIKQKNPTVISYFRNPYPGRNAGTPFYMWVDGQ